MLKRISTGNRAVGDLLQFSVTLFLGVLIGSFFVEFRSLNACLGGKQSSYAIATQNPSKENTTTAGSLTQSIPHLLQEDRINDATTEISKSGPTSSSVPASSSMTDNNSISFNNKPKTLLTYTGPTRGIGFKRKLYEANTDYFIKHGLTNCHEHDTVVFVGFQYYERYYNFVQAAAPETCNVQVVARRDLCYDMESVRLVLNGGVSGIRIDDYDYFVYLNCGVTGPHPKHRDSWFQRLLEPLGKNDVHMSGLSVACYGYHKDLDKQIQSPHVQSMLYALDRAGLDVVREEDCAFDCLKRISGRPKDYASQTEYIVKHYEMKMSQVLFEKGFAIAQPLIKESPQLPRIVHASNRSRCVHKELWYRNHLEEIYGSVDLPSLEDMVFWKTTRLFPEEIQKLLNYTDTVVWDASGTP